MAVRQAVRRGVQRHHGFSLVELMLVVAVLGVLAALAGPSLGTFVAARRVEDAARRLGEDMALGRNEAVKRNTAVLLCADASVTDSSCMTAPTAADWAKGWRVCYDANDDGVCDSTSSSDPNPVRVQTKLDSSLNFSGPATRVRFNPNGSVTATAYTAFTVGSTRAGSSSWAVRFAASGAMSVRKS